MTATYTYDDLRRAGIIPIHCPCCHEEMSARTHTPRHRRDCALVKFEAQMSILAKVKKSSG